MEPTDYFNSLKRKVNLMDSDELNNMLTTVESALIQADSVGQTSVVERLVFARSHIAREIKAQMLGIQRYVYKSSIVEFIDKVEPKGSVKIIELERYPRIIPEANLKEIQRVQSARLFDSYCVVFTDLSDEEIETPEEKNFRDRNRDPIVFGYYSKEKTSLRSDRFYLITDWEDEYCDLTFDKMIETMAEREYGSLDVTNTQELQRIVDEANGKQDSKATVSSESGLLEKIRSWIKK